jgi:hypothetical protein
MLIHKFEIRNTKHETNSKLELPNVQNCFGHSNFGNFDLPALLSRVSVISGAIYYDSSEKSKAVTYVRYYLTG